MAQKRAIHAINRLRCRHHGRCNGINIQYADYLDRPTAYFGCSLAPNLPIKERVVPAKSAVFVSRTIIVGRFATESVPRT
jgi:hypothetical protein